MYCQCGCGKLTPIAAYNDKRFGIVKGKPNRFINGHSLRLKPQWKGGRFLRKGYFYSQSPNHPRADKDGYVPEHVLVAEKAVGNYLPSTVVIHHINGNPGDNSPKNLVVCNDENYHKILHMRQRAFLACGHAHWRKCPYCKGWDDPANMYVPKKPRQSPRHLNCVRKYNNSRKER